MYISFISILGSKVINQAVKSILSSTNIKDTNDMNALFKDLRSSLINNILEAEINYELGYDKYSRCEKIDDNRRNGSYSKNVIIGDGDEVKINIPRDRGGTYEPSLVEKGARYIKGFDQSIISMYGRGMSMREIQGYLEEMYETKVSAEFISQITHQVLDDVRQWQDRMLDKIYPILYLDCIHVKMKSESNVIKSQAVYIALGVNMQGTKEVLGIWISENEGSKFWMSVITEIKNRGVEEIWISCVDGLKGFSEAINSVYPKTIVQTCIVHMLRNSTKYVSYKDVKEVLSDLKLIYKASTESSALSALDAFGDKWDKKYPIISQIWKRNWTEISPLFGFPDHIRKAIYTTNSIEAVNRQIRKIIKHKGVFPNEESVKKIIYLALTNAAKKWTMPIKNWKLALQQFHLLLGDDSPLGTAS